MVITRQPFSFSKILICYYLPKNSFFFPNSANKIQNKNVHSAHAWKRNKYKGGGEKIIFSRKYTPLYNRCITLSKEGTRAMFPIITLSSLMNLCSTLSIQHYTQDLCSIYYRVKGGVNLNIQEGGGCSLLQVMELNVKLISTQFLLSFHVRRILEVSFKERFCHKLIHITLKPDGVNL